MERDEERPDAEAEEESGPEKAAQEKRGPEETAEAQAGEVTPETATPMERMAEPVEEERSPEEPAEAQAAEATPEAATPVEGMVEPAAEPPGGERRRYLLTAGISAAAVVLGAVLFVAGFLTHSLLDDDIDLDPIEDKLVAVDEELAALNEQADEIQNRLSGGGGGGGGTSPTPRPVVAATADDDPFIGPADAPVTIIEFTDYQ
jgi:hypothetical protein